MGSAVMQCQDGLTPPLLSADRHGPSSLRTAGNDPAVRRIRIFYAQNRYHEMSRCEIIVRMARRAATVVGALLACCNISSALNPSLDINQYAHTAWTVRDGLFKGSIITIAQTPDGYLWLGTEFGLLRFDGVRIVPWQPPAGEHLPSSFIAKLFAGRDGRLWIGTDKGLASWKDGKLTQYPELAGQFVGALLEDREGTVWAGAVGSSTGELCAIRKDGVQCYGRGRKRRPRGGLVV